MLPTTFVNPGNPNLPEREKSADAASGKGYTMIFNTISGIKNRSIADYKGIFRTKKGNFTPDFIRKAPNIVNYPHFIVYYLHSIVYYLHGIVYYLHRIVYYLHSIVYYLHGIVYYLHRIVYYLHRIVYYRMRIVYYILKAIEILYEKTEVSYGIFGRNCSGKNLIPENRNNLILI